MIGMGLEVIGRRQPVLDAEIARHPEFAPHLVGVTLAPTLDAARSLLSERPMTHREAPEQVYLGLSTTARAHIDHRFSRSALALT